jgi:hypothetical protein
MFLGSTLDTAQETFGKRLVKKSEKAGPVELILPFTF